QVAHRHGERRVEGDRGGAAHDVGGHDRVLRVDEHLGERAVGGGGTEGLVHLVHGDVPLQHTGEVGDGAVGDGHPQRGAVELALHRLEDQAGGPCGAGGGGHDVDGRGAGTAQVAVGTV